MVSLCVCILSRLASGGVAYLIHRIGFSGFTVGGTGKFRNDFQSPSWLATFCHKSRARWEFSSSPAPIVRCR